MTLRRQLMLVSLLLLTLPWAGCQFVREMESALQYGQEQSLQATTRAIATVLSDRPELLYPDLKRWQDGADSGQQLCATASTAPIIVDGYADGWEGPVHGQWGPVSYRARTRKGRLYLLFSVEDHAVSYHDPRITTHATGDRLVLRTGSGASYVIASAGPGPVQARLLENGRVSRWESRIRGQWQDTMTGFNLELEMPLSLCANRLGFYLVNVSGSSSVTHGNIETRHRGPPPWLIYSSAALQNLIKPFAAGELVLSVVDAQQWTVASAGQLDWETEPWQQADSDTPWPLKLLYRAILNNHALPRQAVGGSFGQQGSAVVAQQNNEQYLSLTDQAFSQLMLYSIAAMLISALGLLGYASWLSWRIRKLSRATVGVIGKDGSVRNNFPTSHSSDELGQLSRQYGQLLDRLREYTDYLRTLSHKLSHELRTPIAVIQSSLDNLDQAPEQHATYIARSREGLARLNHILTAMSEASRLEESVHQSSLENVELVGFCRDILAAYQSVYRNHQLKFVCDLVACDISAAPELLAQLLDKLFDNAASFAPAGTTIVMRLEQSNASIQISVENIGPALPDTMRGQLFDSMVSVREESQQGHLGLGLHIARLIAEFHGGKIYADNLPKNAGVVFVLELAV